MVCCKKLPSAETTWPPKYRRTGCDHKARNELVALPAAGIPDPATGPDSGIAERPSRSIEHRSEGSGVGSLTWGPTCWEAWRRVRAGHWVLTYQTDLSSILNRTVYSGDGVTTATSSTRALGSGQNSAMALARDVVLERSETTTLPGRRPRLRLVGLASITVTFLAASAAPTPLYANYQKTWGFSDLTTTVVFGIYALAFLSALLVVGRLSDHIGRRPMLLAGIAGQVLALGLFTDARSVATLVAARIVQGLAAGTAIGAVGAGMLDIDQTRGAVANATAPGLGTASGVLLSAFAVQWLPAPTHLVYIVLAGVLLVQAIGVVLLPETSPMAPGARSSLVPQIALPPQTRKPLLAAAPVLFAVWALGGFYASLGPSLIDHLVGSASVIDAGLGLGILTGVGALATYVLRARPADRVMLIGTRALMAGVVVVLLSLWAGSPPLFFLGTAVAGIGFGAGFQGGIRLVAPLAHPDQRAGVLSVLFSISYVALGVPAVIAGVAVVEGGGLVATSYAYGLAVIALAATATFNLVRLQRTASPSTASLLTKECSR
jgi:predicted MFS family arabinose efflux permease